MMRMNISIAFSGQLSLVYEKGQFLLPKVEWIESITLESLKVFVAELRMILIVVRS